MMKKKIYIVHCRIRGGGALNVLEAFILKKLRGDKLVEKIYTLYSDRPYLTIKLDNGDHHTIPIITALAPWINTFFARVDKRKPRGLTYFFDYRNLMVFFPPLMKRLSHKLNKQLKKSPGDVLISSFAVAKNIDVSPNTIKEIYFHQPMHYIWPLYEEYVSYMKSWKRWLYKKIVPGLRRRDSIPRSYDVIYANSQSTKSQISTLYVLPASSIRVVHPPIASQFFCESVVLQPDNYFFYINRLTKMFKHLDKIIMLCNQFNIPLIVAGDGPDKNELMKLAGPTISFIGWVSDEKTKIKLMKRSRGVIGIAHESFGIVTAEALLLGVPVFGYRGGATPELVDEGSGVLSSSLEGAELSDSFQKFISQKFDRQAIQDRARQLLHGQQEFRS